MSSQRLTRREIKHDEFASAMGRSMEYAGAHARVLLLALGGVVLVIALVVGGFLLLGRRAVQANEALAAALKVYQAPVVATGAKPDDKLAPSFPTAEARRARAETLFGEVRDRYGMSDSADVAGLYLANIAASKGELDRARTLWTDFVDEHDDHFLAAAARVNLIQLDRQQGKGEEVVGRLRPLLDQSEPVLPKDLVLYELGQTYEQMKRAEEAKSSYQKVVDEYPQSSYAQLAQQRVAALDPAGAAAGGVPGAFPGGVAGPGGIPVGF
jgi:tetratricopeptide (TPR) repeat protein